LNVNHVDLLSVQHEYGIFGGKAGAHLLELLRALRMPIVTTLHTILPDPNPFQRAVLEELARLSERLIVMSESGAELLTRVRGIRPDQIDLIPHGIPEIPVDAGSKGRLGFEGKTVILTFGLLSPDKGIEYVVDALPEILAAHPDTIYVVLGATHPHIVEREGEAYRLMLEARGRHLGVGGSMIFHNRFVSQAELTQFLSAADIYITPYLNAEQITSGTLAYAVGAGKAVISTPYIYARELLAEGRGVLVPWRDSRAIAREVLELGRDSARYSAMCARAYALLGIDEYLRAFQGDSSVEALRHDLTARLFGLFQQSSTQDWLWFEDSVTYCNARLSHALILSGTRMHRTDLVEAGLRSLEWLVSLQLSTQGDFAPIGCNGFLVRGGRSAPFDQQPVEACTVTSACLTAYGVDGDARWMEHGARAFDWYPGQNALQQWLYDPSTGGCRDGLHVDRVNRNQGAESTLSFLMALSEMRAAHRMGTQPAPALATQLTT
jgi:glycosyltransferase involved in cell wall biosynthesis